MNQKNIYYIKEIIENSKIEGVAKYLFQSIFRKKVLFESSKFDNETLYMIGKLICCEITFCLLYNRKTNID